MTPMGHAEAHERILDLALERNRFVALIEGREAALDSLRAHVALCPTCRAEVDAWGRTLGVVETALGTPGGPGATRLAELAGDPRVAAPPQLREAVRAIARGARPGVTGPAAASVAAPGVAAPVPVPAAAPSTPSAPAAAPSSAPIATVAGTATAAPTSAPIASPSAPIVVSPRAGAGRRWVRLTPLAAAAAFVVLVAGAAFVADQGRQLQVARDQAHELQSVAAAVDRLLQEPDHWSVALDRPDGTAAGSLAWSTHDLVVVTSALEPPPAGYLYKCWVERNGVRSPIGEMHFAGGTGEWTGYWVGSLDSWATTALAPGSQFGVSLVPLAGGAGGTTVLVGNIGS